MKKFHTIGELSKISGIPVSTLRYYHKIKLFKPDVLDENTGYRYYSSDQLYLLELLGILRVFEIPIDDIKNIISQPDIQRAAIDYLNDYRTSLISQIKQLQASVGMVEYVIESNENIGNLMCDGESIIQRPYGEKHLIFVRRQCQPMDEREWRTTVLSSFGVPWAKNEKLPDFIRCMGMISSRKHLLDYRRPYYDGIFVEPVGDFSKAEWMVITIPAGDFLTLRFRSTKENRLRAFAKMADHIETNGLETDEIITEALICKGIMPPEKGRDVIEIRVRLL